MSDLKADAARLRKIAGWQSWPSDTALILRAAEMMERVADEPRPLQQQTHMWGVQAP